PGLAARQEPRPPKTAAQAQPEGWKFDALRLKNGRTIQGLLVAETAGSIRFRYVVQRPGARTVVFPPTTFARAEIAGIDRLDERDHAELAARLQALEAPGREGADGLELRPVAWGKNGKG